MGRALQRRPTTISDAAIALLLQVKTNADLDLAPSLHETIKVVQQLLSGKAPGSDAIPAETYKHGGPLLVDHLTALFQEIRLNHHLKQGLLSETQCGFRRHRETTDKIFAARQLQEKCQEMRTHLYSTFVDLTKAFDTVNREGLREIMQKFGCSERFTQMVRQLRDGMMATDSQIFYLWRMHFRSNVFTIPVHELLFANDCALNTTLEGHMQRSIYLFTAAGDNFGLVINTEKTVVMRKLPPDAAEVTPHINVKES
nr:unnamed protein product [Spirometra erinaceieuropaei]